MGGYDDLLGDGRLLKRVVATGTGDAPRPGGAVAVRYETRVVREAGDATGEKGKLGEVGEVGELTLGRCWKMLVDEDGIR